MIADYSASNLKDLYGKGFVYVDKTGFLKEWWNRGRKVTLITRPRRFGKTLTLSMIETFFSPLYKGVTKQDGSPLFEGLTVWEDEEMRALQGTVPVISMTLSGAKNGTKEEMHEILSTQVGYQFLRYDKALAENSLLSQAEKKRLHDYAKADDLDNPAKAFVTLCMVLKSGYGEAPILLLVYSFRICSICLKKRIIFLSLMIRAWIILLIYSVSFNSSYVYL